MDKAPESLLLHAPEPPADAAALLQMLAAVLARPGLEPAATALAVALSQSLGAAHVVVALRQGTRLASAGDSLANGPDARRDLPPPVQAALHEAIDQQRTVSWPPAREGDVIVQAQRQWAGAGSACAIPLAQEGRIVGAISLKRDAPFTPAEITRAEDLALLAAPVLEARRQAELSGLRRWREQLQRRPGGLPRRAGIALGLVAVLAVPVPWRVTAPARLEGLVQRALVAATDGYLQQVGARPGDTVREGQVLVQLASQDLELERRRREMELRQHETAFRAAQARQDRTQMVVSQSRAAEAEALLALAETQLARSRVTAPFDGVVIQGDLSPRLGAPVQRGEVLMVVAPAGGHRLIVEVDEADIGRVRAGQPGALALSARPGAPLAFTVERVLPVASVGEGRNFFEVEGQLSAGDAATLRPGLSGVAKVDVGWRPLGAWLLARPWHWLRLAWWRLGP